jgi:uncharacterized membrane protein
MCSLDFAFMPRRLPTLTLLVVVALLLLGVRVLSTGRSTYAFLVWNLALALAPLPLGSLAIAALRNRTGGGLALGVALALIWLAFFPNAPYLATDFVHLHRRKEWSWLDVGMMTAFAGAGWLAGVRSLVQWTELLDLRRRTVSAAVALTAIAFASGFGIYLGRVHRLNSWNVATNPSLVVDTVRRVFTEELAQATACATLVATALVSTTWLAIRRSSPSRASRADLHRRTDEA